MRHRYIHLPALPIAMILCSITNDGHIIQWWRRKTWYMHKMEENALKNLQVRYLILYIDFIFLRCSAMCQWCRSYCWVVGIRFKLLTNIHQ